MFGVCLLGAFAVVHPLLLALLLIALAAGWFFVQLAQLGAPHVCPHCGKPGVRATGKPGDRWACAHCGQTF